MTHTVLRLISARALLEEFASLPQMNTFRNCQKAGLQDCDQ